LEKFEAYGVQEFLSDYPLMTIKPGTGDNLELEGIFQFVADSKYGQRIVDRYSIRISVPNSFPKAVPVVRETDRKIPRDGQHHVNPDDTLCLGSPIRLLKTISVNPTLTGFAEKCLVPFLYAISVKMSGGGNFILGELPHGTSGILSDYQNIFRLKSHEQALYAIRLLTMKKRIGHWFS